MTTADSSPRSTAHQQIIDRASTDPAFRAQLLENPGDAIRQQLGIPLPANITIRVIEEQPGEVVLVLPARPMDSGSALSDADLEAVAGGDAASWTANVC